MVALNVLLGFEAFLLKQCVLLTVKHLKTFRTLDESMKHLLGNYYAKTQNLTITSSWKLFGVLLNMFHDSIGNKGRRWGWGRGWGWGGCRILTKTTNVSILELVEHFVSIPIILISNNNTKFIKGINRILWGTKDRAASIRNCKPNRVSFM